MVPPQPSSPSSVCGASTSAFSPGLDHRAIPTRQRRSQSREVDEALRSCAGASGACAEASRGSRGHCSRVLPARTRRASPIFVIGCPRSGTSSSSTRCARAASSRSFRARATSSGTSSTTRAIVAGTRTLVAREQTSRIGSARYLSPRDPAVRARRPVRRQDAGELPPRRLPRRRCSPERPSSSSGGAAPTT